jgi:hypothetical protein
MSRRCAAILALLLCFAAAGARADEPTPAERAEAKRLFRAGEQAYHAGKYDLAAQAFEASYRLLPAPQIAFSMGQAYRLRYFVEQDPALLRRAIELFRLYLEQVPSGGKRGVAATHLGELEPILLRVEAGAPGSAAPAGAPGDLAPAPTARASRLAEVMVTSPIDGAMGSIAGTRGRLPLKVELEPGRYQAKVTAPGHASGTKTVDVVAGRFFVVEVPLRPIPARVAVTATSGAAVRIDGDDAGATPLRRPLAVASGSHVVAVLARGHRPWSRSIAVERGQVVKLDAELRRTTQRKLSYAVLGLGGVALGGATVTGWQALREHRQARAIHERYDDGGITRGELEQYGEHRDRRDAAALVTYSLLGATALTVAGGLALYWFDVPEAERAPGPAAAPAPASPRRPQITPMLDGDAMGVSMTGRF